MCAYCTADDVREITILDTDDITDATLEAAIAAATAQLNKDINTDIIEEKVQFIDEFRQNKIDDSNTVYYVQDSWKGRDGRRTYIGDRNNDGVVGTTDVLVYIYDSSADTRTQATVSAVDSTLGKITLSSAPVSSDDLTISYARAPRDESTPDALVKEACRYLAASLSYLKLRGADYQRLRLGDLSISSYTGGQTANRPFMTYLETYDQWVNRILSGELNEKGEIETLPYLTHPPNVKVELD